MEAKTQEKEGHEGRRRPVKTYSQARSGNRTHDTAPARRPSGMTHRLAVQKSCASTCQPSPQQPRCESQRSTSRCTPPQFLPFPSARPRARGSGMTGIVSANPPAEAPRAPSPGRFTASTRSDPPQHRPLSGTIPARKDAQKEKGWQIHICQPFCMVGCAACRAKRERVSRYLPANPFR